MSWVCSRCGSRSYHYNRQRIQNICDDCGHPIVDLQREQQMMQYDRAYDVALQHLRAGNWMQSITQLQALINQYPADVRLYKALLQAATKDYSDYEMQDENLRSNASNAWNKLVRLASIDSSMINYSRSKYIKYRQEIQAQSNRVTFWIFASGLSIVIAVLFSHASFNIFSFFLVIAASISLYKLYKLSPIMTLKRQLEKTVDLKENPFKRR